MPGAAAARPPSRPEYCPPFRGRSSSQEADREPGACTSGGAVCLRSHGTDCSRLPREQHFHRTIGELGHEAEFGRSIQLLLAPTKRMSTSRSSTSCVDPDLMAPSLHQVQRDLHRQPQLSRCDQATQVPFHLAVGIVVVVKIAVDVGRIEGGYVRDGLAVAVTSSSGVVATSNRADWACAGTVLSTRP